MGEASLTTVAGGTPMGEARDSHREQNDPMYRTAGQVSAGLGACVRVVAPCFKEPWQFVLECQLQKQQTRCAHAIHAAQADLDPRQSSL